MLKAYKYRLYPNRKQQEYFANCFGCVRFIYNQLLSDKIDHYKETKQMLKNTPAQYKEEFPFLREVKQHRPFEGVIKSCTISMNKSGKYFISILVQSEEKEAKAVERKIGVDLGLSDFAVTTNDLGETKKYKKSKHLYQSEKKLKKAQRSLSRKQKGGKNRNKARLKAAKQHEKIANQRKDFLHKLSNKITDENQVIVIETLSIKNLMKNHRLAKSIGDAGWHEFVRQLDYKAKQKGRILIKADKFYPSSQICSNCGHRDGKKPLHIREWNCPNCEEHLDRDINASKNLLALAK